MASSVSDRTPLLGSNQVDEFTDIRDPREKVKSLYAKDASLAYQRDSQSQNNGLDGTVPVSASNSVCDLSRYSDSIVSIFVVAFDTKSGEYGPHCTLLSVKTELR